MNKRFFKIIFSMALTLFLFTNCKEDKKKEQTDKPIIKEVQQEDKETEEATYYKNAIKFVLDAPKESYAYFKGETGIGTFIKGNEIICFLLAENETPNVYEDRFFANVYRTDGRESLAFEFIDFEKNDVTIDSKVYMFAAFKFEDVEGTSSIQVGQYSKAQKKIIWKVLIPKGRFHK